MPVYNDSTDREARRGIVCVLDQIDQRFRVHLSTCLSLVRYYSYVARVFRLELLPFLQQD
jgi:hypothetical protein